MWRQGSRWLITTALGSDDEQGRQIIDGVTEGEVRSETGNKESSYQHNDGFTSFGSRGTSQRDPSGVSGTNLLPLKGTRTVEMARPPHNSGLDVFESGVRRRSSLTRRAQPGILCL